jgi:hypothetical protein
MNQFVIHFTKLFFKTFLTKLVIFCLHVDFCNLISSSRIGYGTFFYLPQILCFAFCFLHHIAFDFTSGSMNNPLFITTPKNGDPASMSIHEITNEDGNVHFGKVLVPKVAFEDGDVHIL